MLIHYIEKYLCSQNAIRKEWASEAKCHVKLKNSKIVEKKLFLNVQLYLFKISFTKQI